MAGQYGALTDPPHNPLVVLVPMLGRGHMVPRLTESLHATTDRARVLFLCTDTDVNTIKACVLHGEVLAFPQRQVGDYAHKINVGVEVTDEPLIFFGAIDIEFQSGWLEAAERHLTERIRVVGTNDLANPRVMRGEHATHFLVARDYATKPLIDGGDGPLYTGYIHEFVDDEFLGTAMARHAYAFAEDSHVRHHHPNFNGEVEWDHSYRRMNLRMRKSRPVFEYRRRLWT